jgi:hypothetical protein
VLQAIEKGLRADGRWFVLFKYSDGSPAELQSPDIPPRISFTADIFLSYFYHQTLDLSQGSNFFDCWIFYFFRLRLQQ